MHLLCLSGFTLSRLLRGCLSVKTSYRALVVLVRLHPEVTFAWILSHARVVCATYRGDFVSIECRRPSERSFRHGDDSCIVFLFVGAFLLVYYMALPR
jgi:hypothetical protein